MSAFEWNKGGWFGGQIGGTCWLFILGVLLTPKDPLTGTVMLACCAAANFVGWSLWKRRDRLRAYPAIQILFVVEGLFALLAIAFLHFRAAMQHLPEQSRVSLPTMYGALLVFPGLLLMFHIQERARRKASERTQGIS